VASATERMPAEEQSPAIVLRARDYAESDRIVTLLTRDFGKLGGIAKGAKASRHRFERKLEPLSHVNLHFRRRPHGELVFITRAEAADLAQFTLDDDLAKIALGSYMAEFCEALATEQAEAGEAYRLLANALEALAHHGASVALRQAFELRILNWAGFGLDFGNCRGCNTAVSTDGDVAYFVVARGGVICARCRPSVVDGAIRLGSQSVVSLARFQSLGFAEAAAQSPAGRDGAVALARFISSVLDRKLRSAEFLESVLTS